MKARAIDLPLGELELEVMELLWQVGECDVRRAHDALSRQSERSTNTVQSTLERLHRKGLLLREKQGRAFQYSPAMKREDLLLSCVQSIANKLGGVDHTSLMAAFLTLNGETHADLDQLQSLIDAYRNKGVDS